MADTKHANPAPGRIHRFIFFLFILPALILAVFISFQKQRTVAVFPDLDPNQAASIRLTHQNAVVEIARQRNGQWIIPTTADVPGDNKLITERLEKLAALQGQPQKPKQAPPEAAPAIAFRIQDAGGKTLAGGTLYRNRILRADGLEFQTTSLPALPLWPSAWADVSLPDIASEDVALVEIIDDEADVKILPPAAIVQAGKVLSGLRTEGFTTKASHDWSLATRRLIRLTDGRQLTLEQIPSNGGGYWLALSLARDEAGEWGKTDQNMARIISRLAFPGYDQLD